MGVGGWGGGRKSEIGYYSDIEKKVPPPATSPPSHPWLERTREANAATQQSHSERRSVSKQRRAKWWKGQRVRRGFGGKREREREGEDWISHISCISTNPTTPLSPPFSEATITTLGYGTKSKYMCSNDFFFCLIKWISLIFQWRKYSSFLFYENWHGISNVKAPLSLRVRRWCDQVLHVLPTCKMWRKAVWLRLFAIDVS